MEVTGQPAAAETPPSHTTAAPRDGQPATSEAEQLYRVVLDRPGGSVAGPSTDRATALAGFDTAVATFADEITTGRLRVRVLAEHVWAKRDQR
jgi:hypothetical protein